MHNRRSFRRPFSQPEQGEPKVFIVEGWGYDGKHLIKRITGLSERSVGRMAFSQHGFSPKEDLYIKAEAA